MKENISKLQSFIANNNDLDSLEAVLNEFNSFNILGIAQHEIRHSNILSWLFDPNGNHNLGDMFLKKFLSEAIVTNENIDIKLNVFDIQMMTLRDALVKREWENIDLLIESKQNKLVVLIENKINSRESKGQLAKYYEIVRANYKGYNIIPLFLTLDNSPPSELVYGSISHAQILSIIKFIISIKKENISSKVYGFIQDYIKILEILTMENKEIKNLCKKIYKEHKNALDLIFEYAEETESANAAEEYLDSIDAEILFNSNAQSWFIPKEIRPHVKKIGLGNWAAEYPFAFWFAYFDDTISLILEIGPFVDESKRQLFLNHLKKHGFKIHDRSFKPGAKYTRIFSKYPKFEDWDSKEALINKMDDLFSKSAKEAYSKILKACKSFDWE